MLKRLILVLFLAGNLSGCYIAEADAVVPMSLWWSGIRPPENASQDFKDGFWDGCITTLTQNGWGPWKTFHGLRYDGYRMVESEEYVTGWHMGNESCIYYYDHRVT